MFLEHDDLYQAGGHSHIQIGAEADRAAGRMPLQPRGAAGSGGAARRGPSRLRDDARWRSSTRRCAHPAGRTRRRCWSERWIDARRRSRSAFPQRLSAAGQALPLRARLARDRPDQAACRRCPTTCRRSTRPRAERPFRLVTAPARQFLNTSFTETPRSRKREGRPTALIHPDDAARLGIAEGGACGWATRAARWWCMRSCSTACSPAWWWWRASGRTPRSRAASASTR